MKKAELRVLCGSGRNKRPTPPRARAGSWSGSHKYLTEGSRQVRRAAGGVDKVISQLRVPEALEMLGFVRGVLPPAVLAQR